MIIIRDDARVAKLKKRSQQASLIGFVFLLAGFVIVFASDLQNLYIFQTAALVIGFGLSQYGIYLAHRYARSPRPDEILDNAVKKVARDGRMYHYVLPAPHVLLTPAGPIVFVLKYQTGKISATGDKWRQKGLGLRRFFGQEGLGNPTREAESMIRGLANHIRKNAPEIEEVPIGALIVFTTKNIESLNVAESSIPAMHASKVRGFLKQKGQGERLPEAQYEALRSAFDQAVPDLVS
jgi:hypothetical protein